ncbi:hypothetical protein RA279_28035, partial [Pseudomonas syringae pv. tagetis]|uniref:hypothetical protein n=1 Tax=Pseudomonas syringae group genomosp. 7 TaxID=251699 RepID=UPI00377053E2
GGVVGVCVVGVCGFGVGGCCGGVGGFGFGVFGCGWGALCLWWWGGCWGLCCWGGGFVRLGVGVGVGFWGVFFVLFGFFFLLCLGWVVLAVVFCFFA